MEIDQAKIMMSAKTKSEITYWGGAPDASPCSGAHWERGGLGSSRVGLACYMRAKVVGWLVTSQLHATCGPSRAGSPALLPSLSACAAQTGSCPHTPLQACWRMYMRIRRRLRVTEGVLLALAGLSGKLQHFQRRMPSAAAPSPSLDRSRRRV